MKKLKASIAVARFISRAGSPQASDGLSAGQGPVPASGFAAIQSSEAAAAAVNALSEQLGKGFADSDAEDESRAVLLEELARLEAEAGRYINSTLRDEEVEREWSCSALQARVIHAAWRCVQAVHEDDPEVEIENIKASVLKTVPASRSEGRPATSITLLEGDASNPLLPAIVVAIRGSPNPVNHMYSSKAHPAWMQGFVDLSSLTEDDEDISETTTHPGFLGSAKALSKLISLEIKLLLRNNVARHLIFTGHSGGGAIASLLYMHLLSGEQAYRDLVISRRSYTLSSNHPDNTYHTTNKFSCITFGSPPVTSRDLTSIFNGRGYGCGPGINVAVVNEHDVVTRVDTGYMRALVDLYRASYGIARVPDGDAQDPKGRGPASPRASRDSRGPRMSESSPRVSKEDGRPQISDKPQMLPLPQPKLWLFGTRVLLREELVEAEAEGAAQKRMMRALQVAPDTFSKLLFAKIDMHKRAAYEERMKWLLDGQFNGGQDW